MLWQLERHLLYCCNTSAKLFPRVSINLMLAWALYTLMWNAGLLKAWAAMLLAAPALILVFLCAISYNLVWHVGPGAPQDVPDLCMGPESVPAAIKFGVTSKRDGGLRYCSKCSVWKPDRAHHCSSCRSCRLRMDHHCPWFSCCVGFNNHKFFVQFLWYVTLLCTLSLGVGLVVLCNWFGAGRYETDQIDINLVMFSIVAGVFAISMLAFGAYTTYQVATNVTTIESMERGATNWRTSLAAIHYRYREAPTMSSLGNVWDLGRQKNMNQVLGNTWAEWLLPIAARTKLDGTTWPTDDQLLEQAETRAQTEREMLARHYN